eukprot:GHVU01018092.1.p1 GENE.GHVU01018092.1~~GHVU01018092.1.p1  ORF type:complete len:124 (+),score=5.31 GHVU01018092.1:420-791(+)
MNERMMLRLFVPSLGGYWLLRVCAAAAVVYLSVSTRICVHIYIYACVYVLSRVCGGFLWMLSRERWDNCARSSVCLAGRGGGACVIGWGGACSTVHRSGGGVKPPCRRPTRSGALPRLDAYQD